MFAALELPWWSGRARCGAVAPMKPASVILALDASSTTIGGACTQPTAARHGATAGTRDRRALHGRSKP